MLDAILHDWKYCWILHEETEARGYCISVPPELTDRYPRRQREVINTELELVDYVVSHMRVFDRAPRAFHRFCETGGSQDLLYRGQWDLGAVKHCQVLTSHPENRSFAIVRLNIGTIHYQNRIKKEASCSYVDAGCWS